MSLHVEHRLLFTSCVTKHVCVVLRIHRASLGGKFKPVLSFCRKLFVVVVVVFFDR